MGSYLSFQHDPQWHSRLWQDAMRGLSTRQYGPVVRRFADAYGIEESVVSEQFIEASRQKLRELIERPVGNPKLCAVMIDGIAFDGETFVVALGVCQDWREPVLGLRQGPPRMPRCWVSCVPIWNNAVRISRSRASSAGRRQGAQRSGEEASWEGGSASTMSAT